MEQEVYSIMNDIADSNNVSGQHIQYLGMCFQDNPSLFTEQLEKSYLKIIKNFSSTNKIYRKVFECVTEKLFAYLIKKWGEQSQVPAQKTRKQMSTDNTRILLLHMLQLFSEGLDSTQFGTRICCGRHLFMALRSIPPEVLNQLIDEKVAYELLNNTVGLFRNNKFQKTGKTQKGLAVKLGSYLQHISFEDKKSAKLKEAIVAMKAEMVKTICEEEKKELRLDALTNTELNDATLPFILVRIRDTDPNVRLQVFKKLLKNKLYLQKLNTLDIYQVIYDGLGNSCTAVVEQCESYIIQSFDDILSETEERQKSNRKSYSNEMMLKVNKGVNEFLNLFQIEKTLIFPQLYQSILDAFKIIIKNQNSELAQYFRESFKKLVSGAINPQELVFLKVLCQLSQNTETKQLLPQELLLVVDHSHPEAIDLAKLYFQQHDLLFSYELLQLTQLRINCDELGRTHLLNALKQFINHFQSLQFNKLQTTKYNEIYEDVTDNQLESRWFSQHHFEMPIIRNYFDLLIPAIKVIKNLVTDQDVMVELLFETISNIRSQLDDSKLLQLQQQFQTRIQEKESLLKDNEQLNKKKKQNQQPLQLNEQLIQQNQTALDCISQEIQSIQEQNQQMDIHALSLLDALFNQFDISKVEDRVFLRLKHLVVIISDKYTTVDQSNLPKKLSFRCLGYIPLFGLDVGGSTIATLASILETASHDSSDDPITITALRSILDSLLMYDGDQQWVLGTETYTKPRILQTIMNFAFKSSGQVQAIALEGISKLLLHQKVQKPQTWVALFLLLWFDTSLRSQSLPLQIVTSFFKLFITSSLEFLTVFEQGLEIYFSICCYLHYSKDQLFNSKYLQTQQYQEMSLIQAAQAGIKMMSYKNMKQHPSINEFSEKMSQSAQTKHDYYLGPQERLLCYITKLISEHNNIILKQVLTTVTKHQDFLEMYDLSGENDAKIQTKPHLYETLIIFMEQAIERLEKANQDVRNENTFLNVLKEEVGQPRNDEAHSIRDKVNGDFDFSKNDINQLVKDLKKNQIIIIGQKDIEKQAPQAEDSSEEEERKKRKQSDSPKRIQPKRRR